MERRKVMLTLLKGRCKTGSLVLLINAEWKTLLFCNYCQILPFISEAAPSIPPYAIHLDISAALSHSVFIKLWRWWA